MRWTLLGCTSVLAVVYACSAWWCAFIELPGYYTLSAERGCVELSHNGLAEARGLPVGPRTGLFHLDGAPALEWWISKSWGFAGWYTAVPLWIPGVPIAVATARSLVQ